MVKEIPENTYMTIDSCSLFCPRCSRATNITFYDTEEGGALCMACYEELYGVQDSIVCPHCGKQVGLAVYMKE